MRALLLRERGHGTLMAVAAGLALLGACGYAPDFADDTLTCGDRGACPKGYTCSASNNKCEKQAGGSTGVGGISGGGSGGSGMGGSTGVDGGTDLRLTPYVGTWAFASGTVTGSCSDGSVLNQQLTPTVFIVVTRGGAGLLLQYHCPSGWNMRLPLATSTAIAIDGQTCREVNSSGGINTTFNWSAAALTFTTSNGLTATTSGHLTGPFQDSMGVSGTCDLMFNGSLNKV